MTPAIDPALRLSLAHEARRRAPLPPLDDIDMDTALAIVCAEEARREAEAMTNAYDAEWWP